MSAAAAPIRNGAEPDPATVVAAWRRGVDRLDRDREPAPGFIIGMWPAIYDLMRGFLDAHGIAAARLGYGTCALFGVHRLAGAIRVDSTGVLVTARPWQIVAVAPGEIRYANGLVSRGMSNPDESIPLWDFQCVDASTVRRVP